MDRLLPRHCVLCRTRSTKNLCTGCDADLPVTDDACYRCGIPLDALWLGTEGGAARLCGTCIAKPPPYNRTISALSYAFPVTVLVQRFKFRRSFACGMVLADRMVRVLETRLASGEQTPDLLIPVPLHPIRQFFRVFNQAEVLAGDLSKALGIPVTTQILRRTRRTRAQPGLSATERQKNLSGAIMARPTEARHVALVDDVMTTGATVGECAKALRRVGVESVSVWVAARAQ